MTGCAGVDRQEAESPMGTEIKFHTGRTRSKRVRPSDLLKESVIGELRPQETIVSVGTTERTYDNLEDVEETQMVGRKMWTVSCREDTSTTRQLKEISDELAAMKMEMRLIKRTFGPSHIRNLAAQGLLRAIEHLGKEPTNRRYQDLEKEGFEPLKEFAEYLGVKAKLLAIRADKVITRRNETIHGGQLEKDIEEICKLLENNSDLREEYKHECEILENFEVMMQIFEVPGEQE